MSILKVLGMLFVVVCAVSLWVLEPISLNPFSTQSYLISSDSSLYNCSPSQTNDVDILITETVSSKKLLGVSTGFFSKKCGSYLASVGFSNKSDRLTLDYRTPVRIASIAKPMTAVAIMQLVEQGAVDLDQAVSQYLPQVKGTPLEQATIRQLLNHSSGIAHYASPLASMSFTNYPTLIDATKTFINKPLAHAPGTAFKYSSYGYTVLGALIEEVSKLSYEQYMRENIWSKAGMVDTSVERFGRQVDSSKLYIKVSSKFIRSPVTDLSIIASAGGIQSTANDLLMFGRAIIDNRLISRDSLEQMIDVNEALSERIGDDPYGLGWAVLKDRNQNRLIAHSGNQFGASSFLSIDLERAFVSAVISNAANSKGSVYKLNRNIIKRMVVGQNYL